jgi:DNA-binding response OmpR family regulator
LNNRILLVAAEIEFARSLQLKLEEAGYSVCVCSQSQRAMKFVGFEKYACIAIDQRLKDGAGEKVIESIRLNRDHINLKTPILFMSAHFSNESLVQIGQLIDAALLKPFERLAFVEMVKTLAPI